MSKIPFVTLGLLVGALLSGCDSASTPEESAPLASVRIETVQAGPLSISNELSGRIAAPRVAEVVDAQRRGDQAHARRVAGQRAVAAADHHQVGALDRGRAATGERQLVIGRDTTIREHAVIHVGTHGTLEWLDGKDIGLSPDDASDALIADMPDIYIYNVDVVGEEDVPQRAPTVGHGGHHQRAHLIGVRVRLDGDRLVRGDGRSGEIAEREIRGLHEPLIGGGLQLRAAVDADRQQRAVRAHDHEEVGEAGERHRPVPVRPVRPGVNPTSRRDRRRPREPRSSIQDLLSRSR